MTGEVPAAVRPYRKLLLAVADLHARGYQQLRIVSYIYDLGTWRCTLLPAIHVSRKHGAKWAGAGTPACAAHYSSADGTDYFGWSDNHDGPPAVLSRVIQRRLPELARLSHGPDESYAEWYREMLRLTDPDALPISWDSRGSRDAFETHMGMIVPGGDAEARIPLPPPGHSDED